MWRALIIIALLFTSWACTNSSGKSVLMNSDTAAMRNSSKVLIELFTSQGCSSCPAADKLIGNLIKTDSNIIALSFHVDYWDRLGWKDVFSSHDYTLRQQEYVRALHAQSLYTPQAVVQGSFEMVGSNRARVMDAVNKAKAQTSAQTITATESINGNEINVHYYLSQSVPDQQIIVALVQKKATTSVARGENAGAQLEDYNVVRSFNGQSAQASGSLQLTLPKDVQKGNAAVVLFSQNKQTKSITAVMELPL